jgi:hypothetical protein
MSIEIFVVREVPYECILLREGYPRAFLNLLEPPLM